MGPNDPFSKTKDFPDYTAQTPPPSNDPLPQPFSFTPPSLFNSASSPGVTNVMWGAAAGAGFGVLSLMVSAAEMGQVIMFTCGGALIAWLIMGVVSGRLDVRGAWQALRKNSP